MIDLLLYVVIPPAACAWLIWMTWRDVQTRNRAVERQNRYDAARAARVGDHD